MGVCAAEGGAVVDRRTEVLVTGSELAHMSSAVRGL